MQDTMNNTASDTASDLTSHHDKKPLSTPMFLYYRSAYYEHCTYPKRMRSWIRSNITYFIHKRDAKGFVHRAGFYCLCFSVYVLVCEYINS